MSAIFSEHDAIIILSFAQWNISYCKSQKNYRNFEVSISHSAILNYSFLITIIIIVIVINLPLRLAEASIFLFLLEKSRTKNILSDLAIETQ